jgi:hypothetical protein
MDICQKSRELHGMLVQQPVGYIIASCSHSLARSLSLSLSLSLSFPSTNTRHRHVPKSIKLAQAEKHIRKLSKARRERNALANSKPGSIPARVGERQRAIIAQEE